MADQNELSKTDLVSAMQAAAQRGDLDEYNKLIAKMTRSAVTTPPRANAAGNSQDSPASPSAATERRTRHARVSAQPLAKKDPSEFLFDWSNDQRGLPNEIIRTGLFNIRMSEPRQIMQDAKIATLQNRQLFYSGEELRIKDEDVLMQVMHFQRYKKLGETWARNGLEFLEGLRWTTGMRGYQELYECLHRLSKSHITIITGAGDDAANKRVVLQAGNFFALKITHAVRGGVSQIEVTVPEYTVDLWESLGYTRIDWEQRLKLRSTLARFLHRYYSSHSDPYPMKVQKLHELTSSTCKNMKRYRQTLRSALAELEAVGFLVGGSRIDGNDTVLIKRT